MCLGRGIRRQGKRRKCRWQREEMRTKVSRSEEAGSVWMERGGKEGTERSVGVTGMLV